MKKVCNYRDRLDIWVVLAIHQRGPITKEELYEEFQKFRQENEMDTYVSRKTFKKVIKYLKLQGKLFMDSYNSQDQVPLKMYISQKKAFERVGKPWVPQTPNDQPDIFNLPRSTRRSSSS